MHVGAPCSALDARSSPGPARRGSNHAHRLHETADAVYTCTVPADRLAQELQQAAPLHLSKRPRQTRVLTEDLANRVVERVARGEFMEPAVKAEGVPYDTWLYWRETANEAKACIANGQRITPQQRRCLYLLQDIQNAEAQAEGRLLQRMLLAGEPRRVRKVTVRREPLKINGQIALDTNREPIIVTTTTTEEHEEYDWRANLEALKRRFHQRWGDKQHTELTGADRGPIRTAPELPNDDATLYDIGMAFVEAGLMDADELPPRPADASTET